jgi:hypothetical protein
MVLMLAHRSPCGDICHGCPHAWLYCHQVMVSMKRKDHIRIRKIFPIAKLIRIVRGLRVGMKCSHPRRRNHNAFTAPLWRPLHDATCCCGLRANAAPRGNSSKRPLAGEWGDQHIRTDGGPSEHHAWQKNTTYELVSSNNLLSPNETYHPSMELCLFQLQLCW